jgi:hypothetical protein
VAGHSAFSREETQNGGGLGTVPNNTVLSRASRPRGHCPGIGPEQREPWLWAALITLRNAAPDARRSSSRTVTAPYTSTRFSTALGATVCAFGDTHPTSNRIHFVVVPERERGTSAETSLGAADTSVCATGGGGGGGGAGLRPPARMSAGERGVCGAHGRCAGAPADRGRDEGLGIGVIRHTVSDSPSAARVGRSGDAGLLPAGAAGHRDRSHGSAARGVRRARTTRFIRNWALRIRSSRLRRRRLLFRLWRRGERKGALVA